MAAKIHFRALLKRLVIDLVSYFILDIKKTFNKGKLVVTLFLDIKGAFDIVNYLKLFRRLHI